MMKKWIGLKKIFGSTSQDFSHRTLFFRSVCFQAIRGLFSGAPGKRKRRRYRRDSLSKNLFVNRYNFYISWDSYRFSRTLFSRISFSSGAWPCPLPYRLLKKASENILRNLFDTLPVADAIARCYRCEKRGYKKFETGGSIFAARCIL